MLSSQRIEPVRVQMYQEEVAEKVFVSASTNFMLQELKKLFEQENTPQTGCQMQEND